MPIIISQNTTWKKGEVVNLADSIEVAPGVSLTIEAGVTINGNGKKITNYGTLNFLGTASENLIANDLIINSGGGNYISNFNFNYVLFNRTDILLTYIAKVDISNSTFNTLTSVSVNWHKENATFLGNTFINSVLALSPTADVLIKNNLFTDTQQASWRPAQLVIGSTENLIVTVEKNSFLSKGNIAIMIGNGPGNAVTAKDNYYGTSDISYINSVLLDRNDSLSYSSFISTSHTDLPDPSTPKQDTTAPTIVLKSNSSELTINQTTTISFSLSEPSTNFTQSDVIVNGGSITNFSGNGSTYTATFSLLPSTISSATLKVLNGAFSDAAGNTNADGFETNNTLTINRTVKIINEKHNLSVIVDKGVIGVSSLLLKDLNESITFTDNIITKHTIEYAGLTFDYSAIDSLITTVTRDDEFTTEFRKELTDFAPTSASLSYKDAALLIGLANIDTTLIFVAGADGNFID